MSLSDLQTSIDQAVADRDAETRRLREQGMTLEQLAIELGVSKQRVHQRLQEAE